MEDEPTSPEDPLPLATTEAGREVREPMPPRSRRRLGSLAMSGKVERAIEANGGSRSEPLHLAEQGYLAGFYHESLKRLRSVETA